MHTLHQQIAGSNFMIAFATAEGLLLDIISDSSFSDASNCACIRAEPSGRKISAAPTDSAPRLSSKTSLSSCMDVSIFFTLQQPDLRGGADLRTRRRGGGDTGRLVGLHVPGRPIPRRSFAMAATQIENGLFREQHRGHILIAFHNRGEYLHTLSAGLLAVDDDGKILAQTVPRASCCMDCSLRRAPVRRCLRAKFSAFVDKGDAKSGTARDDVGASSSRPSRFPAVPDVAKGFRSQAPLQKEDSGTIHSADSDELPEFVRRVEIAASRKIRSSFAARPHRKGADGASRPRGEPAHGILRRRQLRRTSRQPDRSRTVLTVQ